MKITDLVKNDNTVKFSYYRKGFMFYLIQFEDKTYQFPVPISDLGDATLLGTDKAMIFMRYIRKAIESNELVQVGN